MKYLHLIMLSFFLMVNGKATAQHKDKEVLSEKARAENFDIELMKDIEDLNDSMNLAHHEPHKSSFKIIHLNFDVSAKDGVPVETGFKTVMMRLIDSHGVDIYDPIAGGGFFMTGGKETPYTFKQSFTYDGKTQHIEFLYKNPKKYHKGLHIIEIFMDGAKIGEEHFIIK
ncbi:MAG: hypothetical protein JWM14_1939 [Chitinophagaceae bacterium]|nr:hypothetical protein [Chitinophagaceae bacterium]